MLEIILFFVYLKNCYNLESNRKYNWIKYNSENAKESNKYNV